MKNLKENKRPGNVRRKIVKKQVVAEEEVPKITISEIYKMNSNSIAYDADE